MATSKSPRSPSIAQLVKRSTEASGVPERLDDLLTAHVVAQTFLGAPLQPTA